MIPTDFPETNAVFGPPADMQESQVRSIRAFRGESTSGSCDGVPMVVVAWTPDAREIEVIKSGGPIFLTFMGGIPPHFVTTSFAEATKPA